MCATYASVLGHKRAQETLDTYRHLWPDSDDRTRDAVDAELVAPRPREVAGVHRHDAERSGDDRVAPRKSRGLAAAGGLTRGRTRGSGHMDGEPACKGVLSCLLR